MPLLKEQRYTIDDIYNLPEGNRAELIDGQIYMMAPPSVRHQRISGRLFNIISNYIHQHGGVCEPFIAPFAVFLNEDDEDTTTYVEPDVSVVCDPKKITDKGCSGAPDFIIEVVSPSSRRMDYNKKNSLYATSGVREYWIVDPQKERTTVYRYEEDAAPIIIPFSSDIQVGIYRDLSVNIAEMLR
jgi:Uma2 family endonuclease